MTPAEKRRRNRMMVARREGDDNPQPALTGCEVTEIWSRSGKIAPERAPSNGNSSYRKFRFGKGTR